MEGEFGTGKTLCAYVTARLAQENGWTFIMIDRATALTTALNFGMLYQPCIIFTEDIDRETAGVRTPELDAILNVVDGIGSKGKEIMVVVTSNQAASINRAMLRPGRLDAIISVQPPDAKAAERLIRLYGRGLIAADEPLQRASAELNGQIPAVIRECVERSKLWAISRSPEAVITLRDEDLMRAAISMKHHLELLRGKQPDPITPEHHLGAALVAMLQKSVGQPADGKDMMYTIVEDTQATTDRIAARLGVTAA
jgi:transitional endoplasmic reticulum ATPase